MLRCHQSQTARYGPIPSARSIPIHLPRCLRPPVSPRFSLGVLTVSGIRTFFKPCSRNALPIAASSLTVRPKLLNPPVRSREARLVIQRPPKMKGGSVSVANAPMNRLY